MYKNNRGMSGIVVMLIIIALALVAIGSVWYVVQNLLSDTTDEVTESSGDLFSDCVADAGGSVMINSTHTDSTTLCGGEIRIIGGEYCCI